MQRATATSIRPRIAMTALLIAASIILAGCSTVTTPPAPAENTPASTPATSDGYVYEDVKAGYAVTFPGEPEVGQLAIEGTDRTANLVGYLDAAGETTYISRGELRDFPADLRGELFGWLQSVNTTGQIGASSYELVGLSALRAEFAVDGQDATTVVAGEGNRFFQLIAAGGTPEERQEFIDSFELLD